MRNLRYCSCALAISLLFGTGCSYFKNQRAQDQLTACKFNLKDLGTASEMYSTDSSGLYPTEISFLTPKYLKTIPHCPSAGKDTYSSDYRTNTKELLAQAAKDKTEVDTSQAQYHIQCSGEHHRSAGLEANYPACDSMGVVDR